MPESAKEALQRVCTEARERGCPTVEAIPVTWALCEIRRDTGRWILVSTGTELQRFEDLAARMNALADPRATLCFRVTDYATARDRILAS